jgi:hypothetical protein
MAIERVDVLNARVTAMCAAPAGCRFLMAIEEYALSPEVAARPRLALHLVAEALKEISPWAVDHEQIVAETLAHGPRLRPLCHDVLAEPKALWWFGPLERQQQEWISRSGEAPQPDHFLSTVGPPDTFARYAEKPGNGFFTSTGIDGTSGAIALLADGYGDYEVELPLVRYRIGIRPSARVFEVNGPGAWFQLCANYPDIGLDGRLVPNWAAVAREWDGVHLTLGGLLTAEQVRVNGPEGWAEHSRWDTEQTVWLRWVFAEIERLPDVSHLPHPFPTP